MTWSKRFAAVAAIGIAVAVGVIGGIAAASIPDKNGTLHGCVSGGVGSKDTNPAGTLSVIDDAAGQVCPKGDQAITFNKPAPVELSSGTADAHKKVGLKPGHRTTVLATTITTPRRESMWTQPSLDVTAGAKATKLTLRLIVDGAVDEAPVIQTVPARSTWNIMALLKCNGLVAGTHEIGVALISSAAGASVGQRTMLVQAAPAS